MAWTPIVARHLDTTRTADTGESARRETFHGMTTYPRHVPRDVWAGNPDTDKYWAKGE